MRDTSAAGRLFIEEVPGLFNGKVSRVRPSAAAHAIILIQVESVKKSGVKRRGRETAHTNRGRRPRDRR